MTNEIPTKQRQIVKERSKGRCERCTGHAREMHHRRRRGVRDEHTHCPCNLVHLCGQCHRWATVNPQAATLQGWIVPFASIPTNTPVNTAWGKRQPTCDGGWEGER